MFNPKTQKLKELSIKYPNRIQELEIIFNNKTNVYIDYANIKPWANKLGWHIDLKRLKQFLDSFSTINKVKFYNGTLVGDSESEQFMLDVGKFGFDIHTKPVKIMRLSIDVSSIPSNSPDILKNFIRKPLLQKLKIEVIELLNNQLKQLNEQDILFIAKAKV